MLFFYLAVCLWHLVVVHTVSDDFNTHNVYIPLQISLESGATITGDVKIDRGIDLWDEPTIEDLISFKYCSLLQAYSPKEECMKGALAQYHMWRDLVATHHNSATVVGEQAISASATVSSSVSAAKEKEIEADLDLPIPKIIWMLWFQGWADAPSIVRFCHRSWLMHHPAESGWRIIQLDSSNVRQFMGYAVDAVGRYTNDIVAKSALIRMHLLRKYGGVWVDATVFCHQPLEAWIGHHPHDGDIMSPHPQTHILIPSTIQIKGKSLVVCSWLMACAKGSSLFARWEEESLRYWFPVQDEIPGRIAQVEASLQDEYLKTQYFSGYRGVRIAAHEYFWAHLLLNALQESDPEVRSILATASNYLQRNFKMLQAFNTNIGHTAHLLMDAFNLSSSGHYEYKKPAVIGLEEHLLQQFNIARLWGSVPVSKLSYKRIESMEKFEAFWLRVDQEIKIEASV